MKKSLTILMALMLVTALAACSESPMGVDEELAVDAGEESTQRKGGDKGPIIPPDPEIDPGDGAGGGGDEGKEPRPRQDL
jgi:hypothetical protein